MTLSLKTMLIATSAAGISAFPAAADADPAPITHHIVYRVSAPFLDRSNIYFITKNGRQRVNLGESGFDGDDWEQVVDLPGPVIASVTINSVADIPTNGQSCEIEVDGQIVSSRIGPPPMPALPGPPHTWSLTCKTYLDIPASQLPPPRPE